MIGSARHPVARFVMVGIVTLFTVACSSPSTSPPSPSQPTQESLIQRSNEFNNAILTDLQGRYISPNHGVELAKRFRFLPSQLQPRNPGEGVAVMAGGTYSTEYFIDAFQIIHSGVMVDSDRGRVLVRRRMRQIGLGDTVPHLDGSIPFRECVEEWAWREDTWLLVQDGIAAVSVPEWLK